MKAVILAADANKRISELAGRVPKSLLDVGGRSLLAHQLDALHRCDVTDVTVVVGDGADQVRAAFGDEVAYVLNERHQETSSIYSLWLARARVDGPFVLVNGDVLFYRGILERLLASPHADALAVDLDAPLGARATKVRLDASRTRVVEISRDVSPSHAHGRDVGIVKWSAEGARVLFDVLDEVVGRGVVKTSAPYAYGVLLERRPIHVVSTEGLPWIEIGFDEDVFLAREAVISEIRRLEAARSR
jgi:choline kinase